MKKWKKTLVLFLCALLVSNVIISDYERVEVKAEVATLTIVGGGILVLTLVGLATYQIMANGGVVDKETFMRYYNADKAMFEQNAVDYINRKGYQFKTLNADSELITQIVQQHAIGSAEDAWQKIYSGGALPPAWGAIDEPWAKTNVGNIGSSEAEQIQQYLDELRENQGGMQSPEEDPDHDGQDYYSTRKSIIQKLGVALGLSLMLVLGGAVVDNMPQNPQYEISCCNYEAGVLQNHEFVANNTEVIGYGTSQTFNQKLIKEFQGTDVVAYYGENDDSTINFTSSDTMEGTSESWSKVLTYNYKPVNAEWNKTGNSPVNGYFTYKLPDNWVLNTTVPLFTYENYQKFINGEIGIEEALNYIPSMKDLFDSAKADNQGAVDDIEGIFEQADELGIDIGVDSVDDCMVKSVLDICDEVQPQTDEKPVEEQDPVVDVIPIEDIIPWEVIKDTIKPQIETPVNPPVLPVNPDTPVPPIDKPVEPVDPTDQGQLGGVIGTVFPFCIPFDLIYMFKELQSEPKVPYFEIPIVFKPLGLNYLWAIDFSKFEPVAKVFRVFSIIGFITSLILLTRRLIKG